MRLYCFYVFVYGKSINPESTKNHSPIKFQNRNNSPKTIVLKNDRGHKKSGVTANISKAEIFLLPDIGDQPKSKQP